MTIEAVSPELNIIGCILLDNHVNEIMGMIEISDFQDGIAKDIFKILKEAWQEKGKVTITDISLCSKEMKETAMVAAQTVPSLSSWQVYITKAKQQKALAESQSVAYRLAYGNLTYEELQQEAQNLMRLVNMNTKTTGLTLREGMVNFGRNQMKPVNYIKTGFAEIDKYSFLEKGDFFIIGARPSAGKTAFSINLMYNMAKAGYNCVFFSLETQEQKVIDRLITAAALLDFNNVKNHKLTDDEMSNQAMACEAMFHYKIEVVNANGKTASWIKAEAMQRNAEIIFIDYLGLVKSEGKSRYEKVTNTSLELQGIAKQTGMLVVALCQLNRGGAHDLSLETLRESGQIEQDADTIILLANENDQYTCRIAKNKEGKVGDVDVYFDGSCQKFFEKRC